MKTPPRIIKSIIIIILILIYTLVCNTFITNQVNATNSNLLADGNYANYKISGPSFSSSSATNNTPVIGSGTMSFKIINKTLIVSIYFDHYFGSVFSETKSFNIVNNKLYYENEVVNLPFFYTGGNIISSFNGSFEDKISSSYTASNLGSGITNGLSYRTIIVNASVRLFSHQLGGNFVFGTGGYDYGTSSGLLLKLDSGDGLVVLFTGIFGAWKPNSLNSTYFPFAPRIESITIVSTNINLGSPNYIPWILGYMLAFLPLTLLIIVFISALLVFYISKRRNRIQRNASRKHRNANRKH